MSWKNHIVHFACVFTFDVSVRGHAVAEQLHVSVHRLHHRRLTLISSLTLSFFSAVRLCCRSKRKERWMSLMMMKMDARPKCCDHPLISSRGQRSVFRDAVFPLDGLAWNSGPLPNGDVYIYGISGRSRGHALLWKDAGNDFFCPLFSHRQVVVEVTRMT